jgi:hypothetical protein
LGQLEADNRDLQSKYWANLQQYFWANPVTFARRFFGAAAAHFETADVTASSPDAAALQSDGIVIIRMSRRR